MNNQRGPVAPTRRVARHRPAGWAALSSALFSAGVVVSVLLVVAAPAPASAPGVLVPAAAVTTSVGPIALIVDPATDLDPAGGTINVSGSGFNGAKSLVVAVCADDGLAPGQLNNCVGGSIPNANNGQSWAWISPSGSNPPGGNPVKATWGPGGAFAVQLNVPTNGTLNCSTTSCKIFTRYSDGDASGNVAVALSYTGATASSSAPFSTPPFSSISQAKTVTAITFAPSVTLGGKQEVIFPGFKAGELADVTLTPKSVSVPKVTANGDGIVTVDFTVPRNLPVGPYTMAVVGEQSKTYGKASFLVAAPSTPTSSTPSTSSSAPSSSAVSSSAVSSSTASSAAASSTASILTSVSSSAVSSAVGPVITSAAGNGTGTTGNNRPIWPWLVLGGVILLWIVAAFVFWWLRRKRIAAENAQREQFLAEAAALEEQRHVTEGPVARPDLMEDILGPGQVRPDGPESKEQPPGYTRDEFGLLSGRDDVGHQALLLGQSGHTAPTNRILPDSPPPVSGAPNAPTAGRPGLAPVPAGPPSGGLPMGAVTGQGGRPPGPYGGPQRPMPAGSDPTVNLQSLPGSTQPTGADPARGQNADPTVNLGDVPGAAGPGDGGVVEGTDRDTSGNDSNGSATSGNNTQGNDPNGSDGDGSDGGEPRRRRYRDEDEEPPFETGPSTGRHSR